jgi:hypothetical protein
VLSLNQHAHSLSSANGLKVRARGKLSFTRRAASMSSWLTHSIQSAPALAHRVRTARDRLQKEGLFAKELKRRCRFFRARRHRDFADRRRDSRHSQRDLASHENGARAVFAGEGPGRSAGPDIARAIRWINLYHERALREGRTAISSTF